MPSTFSPSLRIELIGDGEQSGVWGTTTNNNLGDLIEQAITGTTSLDVSLGNVTLTSLNGLTDQARSATLYVYGTPGVTRVITIPNVYKNYTVQNVTTNIIQVKTSTGAAFDCPPTSHSYINCDANNVVTGRSITTQANALTSSNDLGATVQALGIAPINSPAFTGTPTAPTAGSGTNTTQLATTAFVTSAVAAGIPVGVITMWSGSIAAIPAGWALCNGTSGTPDLRDRFVVGAGSSYAVGNTGGANTVTLDTTQIPSHTHTGSGTTGNNNVDHTHSGTTASTDLTHSHTGSGTTSSTNVDHTHSGTTSSVDLTHSHTGSGTSSGQSVGHTHSGTTGTESVGHTHTGSGTTSAVSNDHSHGFSGTTSGVGDHSHGVVAGQFPEGGSSFYDTISNYYGYPDKTYSTGGAGAHSHTYSGNTGGQSANHTHTYSFTTSNISANHTHSFTTGGNSVDHTHTYSFTTSNALATHNHTITTGGMSANAAHTHTYSFTTADALGGHTHTFSTGGQSTTHTHTFSFTTAGTGGGAAHENRPPYMALCYIMRVA